MIVLKLFLVAMAAYLIGSVSFSIWISRLMGNDIREHGSGNAGATNMTRTFGWGPGLMTLAGDMIKALLGMLLGYFMLGGELGEPGPLGDWGLMTGGMAVILGHCFPFTYDFRGGKGVAVGGITSLLAIQVFLNVAVVTNLVPCTGISLPMFSYGGTALLIQLFELGIVLSASRDIAAH